MTNHAWFESPLGPMLVVASEAALTGAYFDAQQYEPDIAKCGTESAGHPILAEAMLQLGQYFAGRRTEFSLPLDLRGTPFQVRVWRALTEIGFGQTARYRDIAERIQSPAAVRAVGAAIGRNPISIIVPCHRVIGTDGSLTGYAGGLDRKRALLRIEQPSYTLSATTVADTRRHGRSLRAG